jgi:NAD+ diphosphatase
MTYRHEELSAALCYGANPLDRLGNRRDEPSFVATLATEPTARALVLAGDIPMLVRQAEGFIPYMPLKDVAVLGVIKDRVLLGRDAIGPVFGISIDAPNTTDTPEPLGPDILALDLRSISVQGLVPAADLGVLAQAKSVLGWHARHRFCSNCGAPTQAAESGWRRDCAACETQHFPRTDPVAIMLVVDGENALLARQPRFPVGMMSCLAGFIEPGETMEDAVRREVAEEAGIRVGRVRYIASQPWPFPSSLMIGCLAQSLSRDIVIDAQELEAAHWFTRAEMVDFMAGRHDEYNVAPTPIAIAHHLIQAWLAGEIV